MKHVQRRVGTQWDWGWGGVREGCAAEEEAVKALSHAGLCVAVRSSWRVLRGTMPTAWLQEEPL